MASKEFRVNQNQVRASIVNSIVAVGAREHDQKHKSARADVESSRQLARRDFQKSRHNLCRLGAEVARCVHSISRLLV